MTEAYFVAAVAVPPSDDEEADVPVFSLQFAWDFEKAQPQTAVATWDGEAYEMIGEGPEPTLDAWTTWLQLRFTPLLN